jgi:hypothetical protein
VSDGGLRGRALVRLAHALTLDTDAERAAAPALARRALPMLLAAHDALAVCWCLCVLSYAGNARRGHASRGGGALADRRQAGR